MSVLYKPREGQRTENYFEIINYLKERGIHYEKWIINEDLGEAPDAQKVLTSYAPHYKPYMLEKGYQTVDVICVTPNTPQVGALREKFLKEHTHSEDEVRFFVKGQGLFWFHLQDQVFSLLCQEGDLLSVPANFPHWFDMGEKPNVIAIRMFTDPAGWVANYTQSGIEEIYPGRENWKELSGANW